MFTHHVSAERARAFKKFLGVRLVSRARLTADTDRAAYFETCSRARRHLFLDPDTGLRTREKLRRLQREDLAGFAYVSHVAFIVVGRDPALVKRARTTLLRRSRLPEDRIVVPGPRI